MITTRSWLGISSPDWFIYSDTPQWQLSLGCFGPGYSERCEQEVEFGDVAGMEVGVVGAGRFGVAGEQGLQDLDQCGEPG